MQKIVIDSFMLPTMRDYIAEIDSGKQIISRYPDEIVSAYRAHIKEVDDFEAWKSGDIPKSAAAIRKAKSDDRLKANGGRIIKARIDAVEARIFNSIAKEFGGTTEAIKHLIRNHDQRELF